MITIPTSPSIARVGGTVSIGIGLVALLWPQATAQLLAVIVGLFLLVDSGVSLLSGRRGRVDTVTAVAQALVALLVGVFLVISPANALRIMVVLIAVWVIIRAGVQLWAALQLRGTPGLPVVVGVFGGISLLVGLLLFRNPEAGIVAFSWLIGIYAIVSGGMMLLLASRAT